MCAPASLLINQFSFPMCECVEDSVKLLRNFCLIATGFEHQSQLSDRLSAAAQFLIDEFLITQARAFFN
jgi:hypothetical protein